MIKFEIVIPAAHKCIFDACLSIVQSKPVKWAYALHPIDEMSSFEHYHLGVFLSTSFSYDQVFQWFKDIPADGDFSLGLNSIEKIKKHQNTYLTYLMHKTKDAIEQGKSAPLVYGCSDGLDFGDAVKSYDKCMIADTLIDDILSGAVRECDFYADPDMVKSIIKANKLKVVNDAFSAYYKSFLLRGDADMNIDRKQFWLYGDTGSGKTALAKFLCKSDGYKDYDIYITSSGSNPFDDYKGQRCVIVDDIDADTMTPKTALKLLDMFTKSAVTARYCNKVICAERIFITSTISPQVWWNELCSKSDGNVYQLLRRLNGGAYHINGSKFTVYAFHTSTGQNVGSIECDLPGEILDYLSKASAAPAFDYVTAHFKVCDKDAGSVTINKDGSFSGKIDLPGQRTIDEWMDGSHTVDEWMDGNPFN